MSYYDWDNPGWDMEPPTFKDYYNRAMNSDDQKDMDDLFAVSNELLTAWIRELSHLQHMGMFLVIDMMMRQDVSERPIIWMISMARNTFMSRDRIPFWDDFVKKCIDEMNRRGRDGRQLMKGLYK